MLELFKAIWLLAEEEEEEEEEESHICVGFSIPNGRWPHTQYLCAH